VIVLLVPVIAVIFHMPSDRDMSYTARLDPSCDLHQGICHSLFPDGSKVSLSISPRPIEALKPLQIQVLMEGVEAQSVEVDFRGVDVNMGYNRPRLKQESMGQYSGTWVLAACALERMNREATILIRTDEGILAAPFRFKVT
jgi:hypothetical protein